jgi:hypothetical protein
MAKIPAGTTVKLPVHNVGAAAIAPKHHGPLGKHKPAPPPPKPPRPIRPRPHPKPATPPVKSVHPLPGLYIIEQYQLITVPGDIGVTRNIIDTIKIAGHAKQTSTFLISHTETKAGSISSTVLETSDRAVTDHLGKSMNSSDQQARSTDQSSFKFDASFHGELDLGLLKDSTDANVSASNNSKEVRDSYSSALTSSINDQLSQTEASRSETGKQVSSSTVTTTSTQSIETFELDNHDNPNPLNFMLCQLSVEKLTALCLVNVQIGFHDAAKKEDVVRPLSGLDALLKHAIAPAHRDEVKELILKEISVVQDYQDEARQFVRKTTGPSGEFFQVIPELSTTVKLKRPDGVVKSFVVPGIAMKTFHNILPIRQAGLIKGEVH